VSTARVRVTPEVAGILAAGVIDGSVYRLPPGQLPGATYSKVSKTLAALGGKWDKGVGGFPVGASFAADLAAALESGVAVDSGRDEAVGAPAPAAAGEYPGPKEWLDFSMAHGRIPFAEDSPPIWAYSGWLRYMVLEAEEMGALLPRWHYVFKSVTNGHVLDEPIPAEPIGAQGSGQKASRTLMSWCDLLDQGRSAWERIRLVMEFLAWGFGIVDAPPRISDAEALRLYAGVEDGRKAIRGVNSRALLDLYKDPCDLFAFTLSQSMGKGWNPNAFFPTPAPVVAMMVEMTMHDTKGIDQRGLTVCDPCCGTGRMLIHAGQKSMRLFAQDIDYMMVLATKINFAFWCPWGLFQWDDEFFDEVGVPGPPVKARTGQLALFGGTVTEDRKNKGRKRADVQRDVWKKHQIDLF